MTNRPININTLNWGRCPGDAKQTKAWLDEAPAVEAKPVVHAKWIKQWHDNDLIGHMYEECPLCGCIISDDEKFWDCKFCPNCGSTMDGKDNVPREEVE